MRSVIAPGKDVSIIFLAQMDTDIPLTCLEQTPVYIFIGPTGMPAVECIPCAMA